MGQEINRLDGVDLHALKPGNYHEGNGLYLRCKAKADGAVYRSWLYRYGWRGRERKKGLKAFLD